MSFIFYYCLENKDLSLKTKKRLIEFIRKSINHLSTPIQLIISQRLHSYRLQYYNCESGLDSYFENFKN